MLSVLALVAVRCGIDVLEARQFEELKGRNVAVITNHTGRTIDGRSTVDVLHAAPGVRVVALFAPEHGIRGEVDSSVKDGKDEKTGLPVYSLYNLQAQGEARYKPNPEQLKGVDTIVFDIQDIGTRFYTYISTMGLAMEVASDLGIDFIVLDRPNPIGGVKFAGPVAEASFRGHTMYHPIPVRHGMTVGELAHLYKAERQLKVNLRVIWCEGWERSMWWDATGLMWVNPSPNMRSVTQALLYPGVALIEATNISVGRGTDTPFELIGAPYINGMQMSKTLNDFDLPGIRFYPIRFVPRDSKFKGEECQGVSMIVTDRERLEPVAVGAAIIRALTMHAPEWDSERLVNLVHHRAAAEAMRQQGPAASKTWEADLATFARIRAKHLHYR